VSTSQDLPDSVRVALDRLREAVNQQNLPYPVLRRLAAVIQRAILPRRKSGRKGWRLDAAWADYHAGIRGLELFRKHIAGHDKMGRWRRQIEERRLMNSLQKRASRGRQRAQSQD
jgi:hypothetical protein